ncbi:MAG: hypothetical protein WCZ28_03270 [Burkholderiaceae bacterium]
MVDSMEVRLLRERIQRQRERLRPDKPAEPVAAESLPAGKAKPLAASRQAPSTLASLGRIVAEHPALVIGLGATVLVAGPQRSIRLARRALRAAVLVVGAYRGASAVLGLVPTDRRADTIDATSARRPTDDTPGSP